MRVLIEEIVEGDLAPGEMLPREVDLVERFGVSRGVIRECIRGLEERGLVTVKHGRGATVCDPADWHVFDPEVLAPLLGAPAGRQLLAEAVECQQIFEAEAAALAASRAKPEDLDDLRRAVAAMSDAASRSARSEPAARHYREADVEFHRAVVRASGNRVLVRMSEPLHRALSEARAESGDRKRRAAEHERILTAIIAGDGDGARTAMREHLAAGSDGRRPRKRS